MRLSNNRRNAIIILVIVLLISGFVFFYVLTAIERTILNFLSLFGTFLSLYGLYLAYVQILDIKRINEGINIAVTDSLNRINQVLSVSELSKANKIIQEIQTSNLNDKYELSLLRMKDLKYILIQIKSNVELNIYTATDVYNKNITDLTIDIHNLNYLVLGKKKNGVNSTKLNSNLEELSTILTEFENKLKFGIK